MVFDDLIEMIFAQNHIHNETFPSQYPPMIGVQLSGSHKGA